MTWCKVDVRVSNKHVQMLESLLESQGALSVTLTDMADTPMLEPGVGETPLWSEVVVSGLFDSQVPMDRLRAVLSLAPGVASEQQISFDSVQDRDWERAWMDNFKPMKFGHDLWIVPGEQQVPDTAVTVIRLDPGLAFGSGTHPTTRLCLEWIDAQTMQDCSVIDFGCGSGVLGIAAALKGARKVVCVDNDPQALTATRDNAQRNGVADRIETLDAEQFSGVHADIIVANILSGTLVEFASVLCAALNPGGLMALSGILPEQAGEVSGAYEQWLGDIQEVLLDDWVLISGRLRDVK